MFNKKERSILTIYEDLNFMGLKISLENLAKMKPTELKKFHKKACKIFVDFCSVQKKIEELSVDENPTNEREELSETL